MGDQSDAESKVFARVDAITNLWLHHSPARVEAARDEAERDACFRLRGAVAIERGWARPEELKDGRERDVHDTGAILIGAWDGVELVGTARLILPAPDRYLPVEDAFGLEVPPVGRVIELSRITVTRAHSDRMHRVMLGLLARTWFEGRARGLTAFAGVDSPGMVRLYQLLGFAVTPLGPARNYGGIDRLPVTFDLAGSIPSFVARANRVFSEDQDPSSPHS